MLRGRLSITRWFAVFPLMLSLTSCGSEFVRLGGQKLGTGLEQDTALQSTLGQSASTLGDRGSAAGQSADSEMLQHFTSESVDMRLTAELAARSNPILSSGELKFRTTVSLLTLGQETESKIKSLTKQSLEIFRFDGSRAYSETKTGGVRDWSLSSLKSGYYRVRVSVGFEVSTPNSGLASLEIPSPLEFEMLVDTQGPEFSLDSVFAQDTQSGDSLLTLQVKQVPLDLQVLERLQGLVGAPRDVLQAAELIERCEPVSISRAAAPQAVVASAFMIQDGIRGDFKSPQIVLNGALATQEVLNSPDDLVASVKCYDAIGNGAQKSISLTTPTFSLSLGVGLPDSANNASSAVTLATPLEATVPMPFLHAGESGINLSVQLLHRDDAQKVSEQFLNRYTKSLRLSYQILPSANLTAADFASVLSTPANLMPFVSTLSIPAAAFENLSGKLSIVVILSSLENEKVAFLASQVVEVYRDPSAPELEFAKGHPRTMASKGSDLALQLSTPKRGAGIAKSEVEITTNGIDWTSVPSTQIEALSSLSRTDPNHEITFQTLFKYPFEREVPLRARVRSTDLIGQTAVSPISGPLTLSEKYLATRLEAAGTSSTACGAPVTSGQAIPKLVLQSQLVCHDSARKLSDAPYVRLLLALENGSEVPFKLADGKSTLSLQIFTSSGLVQTLNVNIAQASGRKYSHNVKSPFRILLPLSTTLLAADRIWIEWDLATSVFDALETCPAPAGGRPRVEIQDTLQDSRLVFDPFGCE